VNLRGTGYVGRDWRWEELLATEPEGEPLTVRVRIAGLCGYLLSKSVAVRTRAATKDYYDFAYVLIHNREGGPRQAAKTLTSVDLRDAVLDLRATLMEVGGRFARTTDLAAGSYAEQTRLVEPELDEATLRADAVVAVAEFLEALQTGGSNG
jgi:hypothetical protein